MTAAARKKIPWGDFVIFEEVEKERFSFSEWYKDDEGIERFDVYYDGKVFRPVLQSQHCGFGHTPFKKKDGAISNDVYARVCPKGAEIKYDAEKNEYVNVPEHMKKLMEKVQMLTELERDYIRKTKGPAVLMRYKGWFRDSSDEGTGTCLFQNKLNVVNRKKSDAGRVKTNYCVVSEEATVSLTPQEGVNCSRDSIGHYYFVYSGIAKSTMGVSPQVRAFLVDYTNPGTKPGEVSEIVNVDRSKLNLPVPAKLPEIPTFKEPPVVDPINTQIQSDITEEEIRAAEAAEASHFDQHISKRSRMTEEEFEG